MKILITGSSGMLGTDLMLVLNPDFQVQGISRHLAASGEKNIINLDLAEKEALRKAMLQSRPDLVIHAAAFTKVDLCEDPEWKDAAVKQNVDVVKNLIEICNEINSCLIFFSTDYVFNGRKAGPYIENDPIEPVNFYGQTKAWAEEALRQKSNRYIIFRVTWLYGENGQHFPKAILKQAQEKNEIPVVADQWGRPTWTRDIAETLRDLLTSRKNLLDQYNKEIFHIGNAGQINWSGYARQTLDYARFPSVKVKEISSGDLKRAAKRPLNSVLSLDKAKKNLGIEMRPWQEALQEFLKGLSLKNVEA